jgi:hypothetical protein
MNFKIKVVMLVCLVMSFITKDSFAQDEPDRVILTTSKGLEYKGYVISDDGRELLFMSEEIGKVYFPKDEVKSIKAIKITEIKKDGIYVPEGPFTTRYAFTTNAMPINKGENYTKVGLVGPEVHFALTDQMTLGMMSSWIASPLAVAVKYSFKKSDDANPNLNFSVGALGGTLGYISQFRGFGGMAWANMTIGNRENNLTFSGGYAYLKWGEQYTDLRGDLLNDFKSTEKYTPKTAGPAAAIGGIFKVGAKQSIVFDSMIFYVMTDVEETLYTNRPDPYSPNGFQPRYGYAGNQEAMALLMIMPGMRFQSAENKAFQVTFGGGALFWLERDDRQSFPFPTVTWFRKL